MNENQSNIPFSDIESLGIRYLFHTDLFLCTWQLGVFCNYSCSYCWPHAHSATPDYKPLTLLTQTMDRIKNQARQQGFNAFRFSFVGGEPTLQKNFIELIHHYSRDMENCDYQSLHMTTNLSRKMSWLKHFAEAVRPLDDSIISASFHKEFANREEFTDKVEFLLNKGIFCLVNIVMVPNKFYALLKDAEYFYNRSINVGLQTQTDSEGRVVSGYTKEMLQELQTAFPYIKWKNKKEERTKEQQSSINNKTKNKYNIKHSYLVELNDSKERIWHLDSPDRLNALNFNKYKGWECSAGYRSLIIDSNGALKRGHVCHDKPIGYMGTAFHLPTSIKPCISPICTCTADNKIPKRKAGTKHSLFKRLS